MEHRMMLRTALPLLLLILPTAGLLTAAAPSTSGRNVDSRLRQTTRSSRVLPPTAAQPAADGFEHQVVPLMRKYCGGCHGGAAPAAGVSLLAYQSTASMLKDQSVWEKVAQNVGSGHMPPPGSPQPSRVQRARLVAWIRSTISTEDGRLDDPGRVTMRRLNRE